MKKSNIVLALSLITLTSVLASCSCEVNDAEPIVKKKINFYVDDTIYYSIESLGNEKLSLPENPSKEGYTFDGWYLDKNYETIFDISYYESHQLVDSIDVFGKFLKNTDLTPIKKMINFYVDENIYFQILTNGNEKLNLPKEPSKEGYEFKGWYKDQLFSDAFDINYYSNNELVDSINVYAKFDLITYLVTFESNGGASVENFKGTVLKEEPITSKDGFTFEGWYFEPSLLTKASFPLTLSQDIRLYAKRTENLPIEKPFEIDENGKIIKVNLKDIKIVNIPNNIDGIDVIEIASELFSGNNMIEEVNLPSTLKNLGYASFKGCTNLKKVVFNSNITTIPASAFENCISLNDINLPDSIEFINSNSFMNTGLLSFKAPSNLYSIGIEAFKDCTKLKKIELGTVKKLYRSCFEGCIGLTSISLPNSLENLDEHFVFYNCSNLETIDMPSKIISISNTLFNGTKYSLTETNWKNNGLYCDGYLLQGKGDYSTKTFNVDPGTKCVASNIVPDYVEEVSLPEGLEVISQNAFARKSKLSKIKIPSSVRYIGKDAFLYTEVFNNTSNIINDVIYLDNWVIGINRVENENTKNLKIKVGTIGIAGGELFNYSTRGNFETVTFNDELKYICDDVFKFTKLKEVNFPSSIEYIGHGTFYNTEIAEVTLPTKTLIENNSFNESTKINRL